MNSPEHLAKARQNELFASSMDLSSGAHIDWALTILFYAALHYVQAYFAARGKTHRMHRTRDSAVGRDPNISAIYHDYRELQHFSRQARYELPIGRLTVQNVLEMRICLSNVKTMVTSLL